MVWVMARVALNFWPPEIVQRRDDIEKSIDFGLDELR